MKSINLLLLAINHHNQKKLALSHSEAQHVYAFYRSNIESKNLTVDSFMQNFIIDISEDLKSNPNTNKHQDIILARIRSYLDQAHRKYKARISVI